MPQRPVSRRARTRRRGLPRRSGRTGPSLTVAALAVAALLACGGCWGSGSAAGSDKAGGRAEPDPIELRLINTRGVEAGPFLDQVSELAAGSIRLTSTEDKFERGSLSNETDALHALQAGRADIALVPTRALELVGMHSFDALMDPMVIDSMALQQRVLADPVAAQMLDGVSAVGLAGVGVLPGPIRLPGGIARPLLGPRSWVGARIATSPSLVGERSLRALGAVPVESAFEGADMEEFEGLEMQAAAISGNQYDGVVRWITANVGLWPRPIAVLANADRWAGLTQPQREVLLRAVSAASGATAALETDPSDIADMCRRDRVAGVAASADDLAELRRAFAPVDRSLRWDMATAHYLERIEELKAQLGPTVTGQPISCTERLDHARLAVEGPTPSASAYSEGRSISAIDGDYTVFFSAAEAHAAGADPDPHPVAENWGEFRLALDRQRFAFTQYNAEACTWGFGTFSFTGDTLTLELAGGGGRAPNGAVNRPGELFSYEVTSYRGYLRWAAVPGAVSPAGWAFKPWRREAAQPWTEFLDARCSPPASWDG
jgi:TRAP-type C4-dicarboxylate transport system substrate-binding protein